MGWVKQDSQEEFVEKNEWNKTMIGECRDIIVHMNLVWMNLIASGSE